MRKFYYTDDKKGVDLICDVCGVSTFVKRTKERSNSGDNEVYEATPEGWIYEEKTEVLCPECK